MPESLAQLVVRRKNQAENKFNEHKKRGADNPLKINNLHNPAKGWRPATWKTAFAESERAPSLYILIIIHTRHYYQR
jgi:hypothetical protein